MYWNYWGTNRGKGPHDGEGACFIRKEQLKPNGENLQNVHDVALYTFRGQ
jgi:hypothetical protein